MTFNLSSQRGTIALLFSGLIMFSLAVLGVSVWLPANEKVYGFLAGIAGNFNGALFMYLQIKLRSTPTDKDTNVKD